MSDNEGTSSESEHSENEVMQEASENESETKDREKIKEELSTMSFADLLKLKEEMGSKLYNKTIFEGGSGRKKKTFSRGNKNRPSEMSSKIKPRSKPVTAKAKDVTFRDPRFDPLCGEFNKEHFKSNYEFVNEIKKNEKDTLVKELEDTEDPKRRKTIKLLIERLDNQVRAREHENREKEKLWQQKLENQDKIQKGEKPIYKKKSEKRVESLVEKYENLKKTNKLQKHIEKKTKKQLSKDRKNMNMNVNM
ncbi:PREDICTED: ribosomal RNA processing protein 36 homolog [Nicrophorus vespilloides]|uniref:rRNA biogenesis protein RRP36 n=1 Tax=Nicrophorus vespilloides TaxID=110193 RepID=A0ABM1MYL5_NICVS|nr:PREDICTED: ribosomal RNA processing protein 36 homolog [Nicrophorus vespilloides]